MNRIAPAVIGLVAALLSGCGGGGPKLASVSGVVTLDGKPYPNAIVSFQPVAQAGTTDAGMGSTALTDENGKYTLTTIDGKNGAVVGKHKVRIQTKRDDPTAFVEPTGDGEGTDNFHPTQQKGKKIDPIPLDWYADTGGKDFTVPDGGTDKADFAIESVKAPPKKK